MNLIQFFESRATLIHPHRWRLGAGAAVSVACLFASMHAAPSIGRPVYVLFAIFSFALMWIWGILLIGVWFHPARGTMRHGSRWWLGLPKAVQSFMRGYGAFFLVLWFACSFLFLSFAFR